MIFYEIAAFDPNDIVFNPMWRQGCFVLPFATRLGVVDSWSGWSMLGSISDRGLGWSYEAVGTSHIILAGLCFAASAWHWTYWDLDVFRDRRSNELCLDLPQVFGGSDRGLYDPWDPKDSTPSIPVGSRVTT